MLTTHRITFIRSAMGHEKMASVVEPLAIAVLSGLTPPNFDIQFFDQMIEEVPLNLETEIVAISVQTFTALQAYELADHFRRQGLFVVLGGYHPTICPEESQHHADTVIGGHAERTWPRFLHDYLQGNPKPFYQDSEPIDLSGLHYDRRLFTDKPYSRIRNVEFGRGCHYACDFCSVSVFNHRHYVTRPVNEVISEIKSLNSKQFMFVDDNFFCNRQKTLKLVRAMKPLKVKWGCQISLDIGRDVAVLKQMADSGCLSVMIGFESLNPRALKDMNKQSNLRIRDYEAIIRTIQKYGILVYGSFVFGYGEEGFSIKNVYDFAVRNKLFLCNFNTLNPMPGTALYQRLKEQKRLLDETWWLNPAFTYGNLMFEPENISISQLQDLTLKYRLKFYSRRSILRRVSQIQVLGSITRFLLFVLINLSVRKDIVSKMKQLKRKGTYAHSAHHAGRPNQQTESRTSPSLVS